MLQSLPAPLWYGLERRGGGAANLLRGEEFRELEPWATGSRWSHRRRQGRAL